MLYNLDHPACLIKFHVLCKEEELKDIKCCLNSEGVLYCLQISFEYIELLKRVLIESVI